MKFSKFKSNPAREAGTWVEVGAGLKLLVARIGIASYNEALQKATKPIRAAVRAGNADINDVRAAQRRAMSEAILLDWEGLTDDNEQPIPYSRDKAYELLGERDFFDLVTNLASDSQYFKDEEKEASKGN